MEAQYRSDIKNYESIKDFELEIYGNKNRSVDKISDALDRAYEDLDEKELVIKGLQEQNEKLEQENLDLKSQLNSNTSSQKESVVAFTTLSKDARIQYADLRQFGYAKMLSSKDFNTVDTIPVAAVKWNPALSDSIQTLREAELKIWLKQKLALDTLIVKRIDE